MFVKQLSVFIENREGRLEQVTEVLKNEEINILSLSMADTTEYGMLRMVVSDPEKAKDKLREKGFSAALDGTNADDTGHYRPGLRAVEELGVISPLKELGYTKRDIVAVAEFYGLTVAGRPASPCMATRIPYGEVLDREVLSRLCQGETMLKAILPGPLRLRLHGRVLRMEAPPDSFEDVIRNRERIIAALKALGFVYITLDIEGFRSGSMDL